jgi:hypothetical protein
MDSSSFSHILLPFYQLRFELAVTVSRNVQHHIANRVGFYAFFVKAVAAIAGISIAVFNSQLQK